MGVGGETQTKVRLLARDRENAAVKQRRFMEALDAGFTIRESRAFAGNGIDVGFLRKMVSSGATVDLMRRVLL